MKPLGAEFRMHAGIASANADILHVASKHPIATEKINRWLGDLEYHVNEMRKILAENIADELADQQVIRE
jgi:hypothetical protein